MNYISTRGNIDPIKVAYAAAGMYAEDGGLYAPQEMRKKLDEHDMLCLAWLSHKRRFAFLAGRYMKDIYIGLPAMFGDTSFAAEDFDGDIPGIVVRDGRSFAEMRHGPSGSPYDLALRPLPTIFEYYITAAQKGEPYIYGYNIEPNGEFAPLVLVPSSGEEALTLINAVENMTKGKIAVFYPKNETSDENRCLLEKSQNDRVLVRAIEADINQISHCISQFIKAYKIDKSGLYPMRGDSQNWFGIISQVSNLASLYCDMIVKEQIKLGDWINLAIPYDATLEMATIAFYAKEMGLNVEKIVCPAPSGSVLHKLITNGELNAECFKEGTFIPVALERLLHAVCEMDAGFINSVIAKFEKGENYILPEAFAKKLSEAFYLCEEADMVTALDKYETEFSSELIPLIIAGENPSKEGASKNIGETAKTIALKDIAEEISAFIA